MMKTRTLHKALFLLLTVVMALNMGRLPVFAKELNPPGITILAGKTQKPEAGRVYYPLSLIVELYKDTRFVKTPPVAPDTPKKQPTVSDATIPEVAPDKDLREEAFAETPIAKNEESKNEELIAAITAILVLFYGGVWFRKKKKGNK